MANNQMTLATPMKTPIAVKKDLMGCVTILSKAALLNFSKLSCLFPNAPPRLSPPDAPVLAKGSQKARRIPLFDFPIFHRYDRALAPLSRG